MVEVDASKFNIAAAIFRVNIFQINVHFSIFFFSNVMKTNNLNDIRFHIHINY